MPKKRVYVKNLNKEFLLDLGQFRSLLDFLEYHNVSINHSCRIGSCQLCICSLNKGKIQKIQEPILDSDDENKIFACCSLPESDFIEIEF